jgi:hypothetical protein
MLIASADVFVVYDNLKYTKAGWINRNRMLVNGAPATFTVPLKKGADRLHINQRVLSEDFVRASLLRQFRGAYGRAPHFAETFELLERVMNFAEQNLFGYLHHSILEMVNYLSIETKIIVSSTIDINHSLQGQNKVLAICKVLGATEYINAQGGVTLYDHEAFRERGIELKFIRPRPIEYPQVGGGAFVPWLSIIDLLMHLPLDIVREYVHHDYEVFK